MTTATLVIPWLNRSLLDVTLDGLVRDPDIAVLPVDNSQTNLGVAWAWNRGLDHARQRGDDWLILCSTATKFGSAGGLDLYEALDDESARSAFPTMISVVGAGWHLHAIPLWLFGLVGPFDEWYLAYCEDTDWQRRLLLAGHDVMAGEMNRHVSIDASWLPDAHSMRLGFVSGDLYLDGLRRFAAKWGHGYERDGFYPTPWNRPGVDWTWTWQDDEARVRGNLPPTPPPYPYVGGAVA